MLTHSFEDYLDKANKAKTPDELFGVLVKTLAQYGFDKVLFALLNDHRDINLKAGVGVIQNYPADWMKYYFQKEFDKIDPIARYAVHQFEAFEWDEIEKRVELLPVQRKCLNMGIEAGLHNGIGVPLRGSNHQIAGVSLASTEKKDACHFQTDLITAYCNHFYMAYKRLHVKQPVNPKNIVLTPRERDILTWAVIGKTNEEIGEILKITSNTVKMHFKHIYEKVEVNNRVLAVVKAINLGLVSI